MAASSSPQALSPLDYPRDYPRHPHLLFLWSWVQSLPLLKQSKRKSSLPINSIWCNFPLTEVSLYLTWMSASPPSDLFNVYVSCPQSSTTFVSSCLQTCTHDPHIPIPVVNKRVGSIVHCDVWGHSTPLLSPDGIKTPRHFL